MEKENKEVSDLEEATKKDNLPRSKTMPLGFFEHEFNSDTIWLSKEVYSILDFPLTEQPPSFNTFIHYLSDRNYQGLAESIDKAITEAKDFSAAFSFTTSSQKLRHISLEARVFLNDAMIPTTLKGVFQDITPHIEQDEIWKDKFDQLEQQLTLFQEKQQYGITYLINSFPGFAFIKNTKLEYLHANTAMCNLLQISPEEIVGKTDYDLFPKALADKYREDDAKVLATKEELIIEEQAPEPGDSEQYFVVATHKLPWFDEQGRVIGVYGLGFDISKLNFYKRLKEANDKIEANQGRIEATNKKYQLANKQLLSLNDELTGMMQKEEVLLERLRLVMKVTSDGIFDWNLLDNSMYLSSRWKEMLGYADDELENQFSTWERLTKKEDVPRVKKEFEIIKANKDQTYTLEFQMRHKDGHWVDILTKARVFYNDQNEPYRVVGTHSDITNENQSEQQYQNLYEEIKTIYDNDPTFILIKDTKNTILKVTESVSHLTGLPVHLMEGKPAKLIFGKKSEEYYQHDLEVIKTKKPKRNIQTKVINLEGGFKWVQLEKIPILNDNNEVYKIIIFGTDITELKLSQQKAEESAMLKTEFLNNLSHEIRTPMNGILGFSNLLTETNLDATQQNYISILKKSSNQLLQIMDDILEISALETQQIQLNESEFRINDIMGELYATYAKKANEKNLSFYQEKGLPDAQSTIRADKDKLVKTLSILLDNALKFTIKGSVEFGYTVDQQSIIFYVKDSGVGIAKQNFDMIFERFSQEEKLYADKTGGLGLGLSISREYAKLMKGSISLESVKGKGSTFYFRIPHHSVMDTADQIPVSDASKKALPTILIAEDEKFNFLYLEVLLNEELTNQFHLRHALNGQEAIDICDNHSVDLILMDVRMPIMDGYEATAIIKDKFPEIPIIFQTAYTAESDRKKAMNLGAVDFLSKPIDKKEFLQKVQKYLNLKSTR